jgi:hypothetical protein
VDDELEVGDIGGERLDHVLFQKREVRLPLQALEPRRHAAHVVVVHGHADRARRVSAAVEVERREHEVVAEEARSAGEQHVLAREPPELLA